MSLVMPNCSLTVSFQLGVGAVGAAVGGVDWARNTRCNTRWQTTRIFSTKAGSDASITLVNASTAFLVAEREPSLRLPLGDLLLVGFLVMVELRGDPFVCDGLIVGLQFFQRSARRGIALVLLFGVNYFGRLTTIILAGSDSL